MYKNFEEFFSEENLNENLRFESKLDADLNTLLEIYQSYYEDLEVAKGATYSTEVLDKLKSIIDSLDEAIINMKKIKDLK